MRCQSDGCPRALRAFSSPLLRRQRLLPVSVASPAEPSLEPPPHVVCSWIEGACVRGSSPPPGPRLALGSSFSLVSGGATLERLFSSPRGPVWARRRWGWPAGPGPAAEWGSAFVAARLPSPPRPARPSARPPVRSFASSPARPRVFLAVPWWRARAGTALFRFSWGGRARASCSGAGPGARWRRWSPAPRARRVLSGSGDSGSRMAGPAGAP